MLKIEPQAIIKVLKEEIIADSFEYLFPHMQREQPALLTLFDCEAATAQTMGQHEMYAVGRIHGMLMFYLLMLEQEKIQEQKELENEISCYRLSGSHARLK